MIKHFLNHQWLQFRRSASFERELGITIFIWIMGIFALVSIISLAAALPRILYEIPQINDPIVFINEVLIYYILGELLIRYFIQKVPALDIQPYLNLPIARSKVANFLIGKSLISAFNIVAVLLLAPFTFQALEPRYGSIVIAYWLGSIFFLSLCLHFFNILFKKKLEDMPWVWAVIILLAAGNYVLTVYLDTNLFAPFASVFQSALTSPILLISTITLFIGLLLLTLKYFRENLYLEELGDAASANVETYSEKLSFLGKSGIYNTLMLQEIKMIFRHKRTRSVMLLSLIFVGYGLIFFGEDNYSGSKGFYVFLGIFMSGLFTINYGQFFWSWNTNQLDFFFTKPLAVQTWLKSRYRLLLIACIITTLLCVPYVYFGWDVLFLILAGSLYNIGINIPLMIRFSLWGPKAIDLNKGAFMNYQGTGAAQWLMGIPLLAGPYVIYIPVSSFFGYMPAISAIAVCGILGFTLRDYFIKLIAQKLTKVKYKLIHDLTL